MYHDCNTLDTLSLLDDMPSTASQARAIRATGKLQGGLDPVETGRKGGKARLRTMTAEQRSEVARQGALALHLKHRKQLLSLVGPALDGLEEALKLARPHNGEGGDPSALIKVVTAILDRTGFHGKSGIEVEGEIEHSGEIVHRHQLLDTSHLPLTVKRLIAACVENDGWQLSEQLDLAIRAELPMLQMKVESSTEK